MLMADTVDVQEVVQKCAHILSSIALDAGKVNTILALPEDLYVIVVSASRAVRGCGGGVV